MADANRCEFCPIKIDDFVIEIEGLIIPLRLIGHMSSPDQIIDQWTILSDEGFPMKLISSLFVAIDYIERTKNSTIYFLPDILHLIRLVDKIACSKSIENADSRIIKLRDELRELIKTSLKKTERQPQLALEIIKKVVSYADEFQIGCILHNLYPNLIFTKGQGPDFRIESVAISCRFQ